MHEGDAGHHLEQFTGNMVSGTDAGRRHVNLGGIGLGIGDESGNRLDRYRGIHLSHGALMFGDVQRGGARGRMTLTAAGTEVSSSRLRPSMAWRASSIARRIDSSPVSSNRLSRARCNARSE